MFGPRNKKEKLILFITGNCEILIGQTHKNPEETFDYKLTQPKEILSFSPPKSFDGSWLFGSKSFEVYKYFLFYQKKRIGSTFLQTLIQTREGLHRKS